MPMLRAPPQGERRLLRQVYFLEPPQIANKITKTEQLLADRENTPWILN